ncbi:MAG: hypothetical protein QXP04_04535, partial [Candidatus Nanoarchaeia archaeon]|nr:hypothetical protein [Candidatus Jingweiarchaeum tengchongense]
FVAYFTEQIPLLPCFDTPLEQSLCLSHTCQVCKGSLIAHLYRTLVKCAKEVSMQRRLKLASV